MLFLILLSICTDPFISQTVVRYSVTLLQDISRLISIEVATFCDVVDKNQRIRRMASDYAVDFVAWPAVCLKDWKTTEGLVMCAQGKMYVAAACQSRT